MQREILVHLLPALFEPESLRGGSAVVIDVLRASTTIAHALAAGANEVIPCGQVEEARKIASKYPAESVLLGGERGGTRISGFDLDNSPQQYIAEAVGGKTIIFTTTNGTQALLRCREAKRVFIGAFVNINAVTRKLLADDGPIHVVCAGTDGHITLEDCLCAGAFVSRLLEKTEACGRFGDSTQLSLTLFRSVADDRAAFLQMIRASRGGANLIALGMSSDIEIAAASDTLSVVPELYRDPWRIVTTS